MKKLPLFAALGFLLLSACRQVAPEAGQQGINTVDSLLTVVDYLTEKVKETDYQKLEAEFPEVKRVYDTIVLLAPQDDKDFWVNEVNAIEQVKGSYEKFLRDREGLLEDLEYSKEQLNTLRNSLEDNRLSDSARQVYLQDETRALAELHLWVTKRQPGVEVAQKMWEEQRLHFDSVARSLQRR